MKRLLWTALFVVPLVAQPAHAQICIGPLPPVKVNGGLNLRFNVQSGCGGCGQLGPWYLYWPMEAHFQAPPPLGPSTPFPSYQTLTNPYGGTPVQPQLQPWTPPSPTPVPPGGQPGSQPPGGLTQRTVFQPVGYFTTGQAPSYWYGR